MFGSTYVPPLDNSVDGSQQASKSASESVNPEVSAPKKSVKEAKLASKKAAKQSKPKSTFRRHILPPLLGVMVMLGVAGFMNGEWVAAQAMYHYQQSGQSSAPADEPALAAGVQLDPNAQPELAIPVINVKAPVVSVPSVAEQDIQAGLRNGVVKLHGSAEPGQAGNVVIFGHSSGQPLAPGNYKFVFTLLNKVQTGQRITVDYKGTRYIYKVTDAIVVLPTEVSVLDQTPNKHQLTLITCSPVGGNSHRLVVRAEQISPKPNGQPTIKTETTDAAGANGAAPATGNLTSIPDATGSSLWQNIRDLF